MIRTYVDDKIRMIIRDKGDIMLKNPYKPGAGTPPAFLAGRDDTISNALERISELLEGCSAQHIIYYGVRGVGKTVLLNKIESSIEENKNIFFEHIECNPTRSFPQDIALAAKKFIVKTSAIEATKELARHAMSVLKAFSLQYDLSSQTVTLSANDPSESVVTGDLGSDLKELLLSMGKLAKSNGKAVCFFIDEIQSLHKDELSALLMAIHRSNQLDYPLLVIGAGLPTILRVTGEAKSYSERMFSFIPIGSLKDGDSKSALIEPAKSHNISFTSDAVDFIIGVTQGYPYFIQEYGKCIWKYIRDSYITLDGAVQSKEDYYEILDKSFFNARYSRTTTKEKEFLFAMSQCASYPCQMAQVASRMKKKQSSISQFRNNLINKGLVYSPSYGEVDFTVPQFDSFLKRVSRLS